jgi:hypothetical protein
MIPMHSRAVAVSQCARLNSPFRSRVVASLYIQGLILAQDSVRSLVGNDFAFFLSNVPTRNISPS